MTLARSGKPAFGAIIALLLAVSLLHAQEKPSPYEVKAAYLYNFGKYVTWPGKSTERFNICIFGNDPFGGSLESLVAGEQLVSKPINVRRVNSSSELARCYILYISTADAEGLPSLLAEARNAKVLTVGEGSKFLDRGGMIQFVMDGDRIRFSVNLDAAQKAGLSLSSELLKVAKNVRRNQSGGGR